MLIIKGIEIVLHLRAGNENIYSMLESFQDKKWSTQFCFEPQDGGILLKVFTNRSQGETSEGLKAERLYSSISSKLRQTPH